MFAKVFSQIFDSSIAEDYRIRHIFMDLLVMSDSDGVIDKTPQAIARTANIPIEHVIAAIAVLTEPDPHSRTKDCDGRRLQLIDESRDWGWRIVNFVKYREIRDEEARRIANRSYKRAQRQKARESALCQQVSASCPDSQQCQPIQKQKQIQKQESKPLALRAEKRGTRIPEGFVVTEELRTWAKENQCPSPDLHIAEFIDYWSALPGQRGVKLDWNATFRNWLRKAAERKRVPANDNHKTAAQLRNERFDAMAERAIREAPPAKNQPSPLFKGIV